MNRRYGPAQVSSEALPFEHPPALASLYAARDALANDLRALDTEARELLERRETVMMHLAAKRVAYDALCALLGGE